MRILNALAALSGLTALALLSTSSHGSMDDAAADNVRIAAFVQLISAVVGVFAAGRRWRLDVGAASLILAGSAAFTCAISVHAFADSRIMLWLAPVGGILMMLGWITLAFAAPTKRPE